MSRTAKEWADHVVQFDLAVAEAHSARAPVLAKRTASLLSKVEADLGSIAIILVAQVVLVNNPGIWYADEEKMLSHGVKVEQVLGLKEWSEYPRVKALLPAAR